MRIHRGGERSNRQLVRNRRRIEPVSWAEGRWSPRRARGSRWLIADALEKRGTPRWRVAVHPHIERSPLPMCFTEEALETLLITVGALPPETGAKGFGPKDSAGFDRIEFDHHGSDWSLGSVYTPDVEWADERREYHLDQPEHLMRVWSGDIHSHPGWLGRPSLRAGRGLGDLGYVEEVFASNEWMEWFFIPIVTRTGSSEVVIHPWVCRRGSPPELMIAELRVCDVAEFPEREYNPDWLERLAHRESIPEEEEAGEEESEAEELEKTRVFLRIDRPPSGDTRDAPRPPARSGVRSQPAAGNVESSWFPTAAAAAVGLACLAFPVLFPAGIFVAGIAVGALAARAFSDDERRDDLPWSQPRRKEVQTTVKRRGRQASVHEERTET